MAEKKLACSSAKNTATSLPGIDADMGNCGRLSGDSVLTFFTTRLSYDPSLSLSFVPRRPSSSTSSLIKFNYIDIDDDDDNDDIGNRHAIRRAVIPLMRCLRPHDPTIHSSIAPPHPPPHLQQHPRRRRHSTCVVVRPASFHARRCPPCLSPPSTLLIVVVVPLSPPPLSPPPPLDDPIRRHSTRVVVRPASFHARKEGELMACSVPHTHLS